MKRFLSIAALLFATLLAGNFVLSQANAQDIESVEQLEPVGLYTFFNTKGNTAEISPSKEGEPKLGPVITALDVSSDPTTGETIFYAGGDAPNFYYRNVKNYEVLIAGVPTVVSKKDAQNGQYNVVTKDNNSQVDDWIRAISVNPATGEVATLSQKGTIVIWNLDNQNGWQQIKKIEATELGGAHAMKFSPNGKILAVCGYNAAVYFYGYEGQDAVFNGSQFNEIARWEAPSVSCTTLDFHSDRDPATGRCSSTILAVGGRQGAAVWDVVNGEALGDFILTNQKANVPRRVRAVAFSPDGKRLAVAGDADQIQIWDIASQELVSSISLSNRATKGKESVSRRIFSMTFVDDDTLATGDSVNDVILWKVSTGKAKAIGKGLARNATKGTRAGHSGTVASLVYVENAADSEAPRSLLTGGFDSLVIRWKLR